MSQENNKKHLLYPDILRVIAILAVIMLHCVSDLFVEPALYGTPAWHAVNVLNTLARMGVPLFFMISGYLIISDERQMTLGAFFSRRITKIVIPFLIWNVVYYLYYAYEAQSCASAVDFLYGLAAMGVSYHFWFVYTLIFIYLLAPIIKPFLVRATDRQLIYALLVIMFPTTFCPLINKFSGLWLFRFDAVILGYAGFFVLGYLLGRARLTPKIRAAIYAGGVGGAVLGIWGTYAYSSTQLIDTTFNIGCSLSAYLIAAAVFTAVRTLSEKSSSPRTARVFYTLGSLTYGVYLIHVLVMRLIFANYTSEHVGVTVALEFLATAAASFAAAFLISRVKILKKILI